MSFLDFSNKTVLITGGTRGIGLESALTFGQQGARCILTYKWGEHSEEDLYEKFSKRGAPKPLLFYSDASNAQDTKELMKELKKEVSQIDIFINNVSVALIIKSFDDYTFKGLKQSISYSSWPLIEYTKQIHNTFQKYPKYILAVSSTGPDHYSFGYDFVAASKIVLETLCRYLNYRLRKEKVCINVVRSRAIKTESFTNTFGTKLEELVQKLQIPQEYWIKEEEVAKLFLALCSGNCDAISGQVLTVDRGTSFFDNFMDLYTRYQKEELIL